MIKLLESDGHNFPVVHLFRDKTHAEEYLELNPGYFDDQDEYVDEDFVSWSVYDAMPEIDHTK